MDDTAVPPWVEHYPAADITPVEFEQFVGRLLEGARTQFDALVVAPSERIQGVDGAYIFDATARVQWAGMEFLIVIEAKRHKNPIKRKDVQVLHSKAMSVGAQKAALISTASFQRGAIEFAKTHRVALVRVTEGRFTFETRAVGPVAVLSREDAYERFGMPTFVGVSFGPGQTPTSTHTSVVRPDDAEAIATIVLGLDDR